MMTTATVRAAAPTRSRRRTSATPMTRTRAQRETSAGGVVYRLESGTPLFLLIRDSYANWGFPKGHLEAGERADEAALREVFYVKKSQSVHDTSMLHFFFITV